MLALLQNTLRAIDVLTGELRAVTRRTVVSQVGATMERPAMVRQLEDRILLSASPAVGDGTSMGGALDEFAVADNLTIVASSGLPTATGSDAAANNDTSSSQVNLASDLQVELRRELLVIDPGVDNYEQLVDDLRRVDTTFDVIVLDASQDGIEQVSAILVEQTDLNAIHFVSHGTGGAVKLGNTWLTLDNLTAYAGLISGWADALQNDADLLFYGCNLAGSPAGVELLDSLSTLTDADVAASVDATGHASLGGDWDLEYAAGSIETAVVVSPQTQDDWQALLSTFTVTNTNDSGAGSLRQAIIDANALPGLDEIHFGIAAPLINGAHTIALTSALPEITDAVLIDGTTDADYIGAPIIELNGAAAGGGTDGLFVSAGGTTIRGLVINRFDGDGIYLHTGGANIIEHNYIGTDVTASVDQGNSADGIRIGNSNNNRIGGTTVLTRNVISGNHGNGIIIVNGSTGNVVEGNYIGINIGGSMALRNDADGLHLASGATNNTIGGTTAGAGNVISGNSDDGIEVTGNASSNNRIEGNLIGVAANGVAPLGNSGTGVWIEDAPNTVIGGTLPGSGNVIGASGMSGVAIAGSNATGTIVQGNAIGTDRARTVNLGNAWNGVRFTDIEDYFPFADIGAPSGNTIGGINAGEANTIAFNGKHGISSEVGTGNNLRGNQIYSNVGLGIDLDGNDSTDANDNLDGDSGANQLQNHPVLGTAEINGGDLAVTGTLNSAASTTFDIDFFASVAADGSAHGEAERYLGTATVVTDFSGNATVSKTFLSVGVSAGEFITATATDASGNTSEFASNITAGATVVLAPTADTYINLGSVGANYGNSTSLIVDRSGGSIGDQRALLQFDLSSIPVGAAVTGATLKLESTKNTGAFDINIYEVTAAWGEGSGNGTADAANWNERQTGINWSTAGGEFTSTAVATLTTGSTGQHRWDLTSLVQAWYGGSKVNNGVIVGSPNTGTTKITYDSKEGAIPPELEVFYIPAANSAPTAVVGGPYVFEEGDSIALTGSASNDPDGDPLSYAWDLDNDGNFGESGEPTTPSPIVDWATLRSFGIDDNGIFTIGLRVDDARGGIDTTTTTLTVNNAVPTLTATGAATVTSGSLYTLILSATDPGDDTITGWMVNWGDGAIEQIAGDPGSVTHTYTSDGLTFSITASATDEDGTFRDNELLVASQGTNGLFRYAATNGDFVEEFASTDGLNAPYEVAYGPDGNIYVSGQVGNHVLRYDGATRAFIDEFVAAGSGGLTVAKGVAFGPDGNLYVASYDTDEVLRYDGTTGTFLGVFVTAGLGGLDGPGDLLFSPDGNLYVGGSLSHNVLRYDAATGVLVDEFVTAWDGGLDRPVGMVVGPDGHLYVADAPNDVILRFDGSTGAYLNNFVSTGSGGLSYATDVVFGPDGDLYVSSFDTDTILRFDGVDGSFLEQHVTPASGGLDGPALIAFTPSQQVTVLASPNSSPVTNPDAYAVNEGATLSVAAGSGLLSNDSDPDADPLTAALIVGPSHGASFVLNPDGSFTYDHDGSETTSDSFTYEASDGNGGTATATVTLSIAPQNDVPVFTSPSTANVAENTTTVLTVAATDADNPTQAMTYSISGGADQASFSIDSITDDLVFVTPPNFENSTDANADNVYEVNVQADDGNGGMGTQSISVTVTDANDAPSGVDDSYSIISNQTLTSAAPGVLDGDADEDVDLLTVSLVVGPAHGIVTLDPDGSFSYTPNTDFFGIDTFTYQVDDGHGATDVAMVSIAVTLEIFAAPAPPAAGGDPPSAELPPASEQASVETASENPTEVVVGEANLLVPGDTSRSRNQTAANVGMEGPVELTQAATRTVDDESFQLFVTPSRGEVASRTMRQRPTGNERNTDSPVNREGHSAGSNAFAESHAFLYRGHSSGMWRELDDFQETLESELQFSNVMIGSVGTIASGLTVGYVLWAVRSGLLLSSVLASMPAWTMFDPLVIASISEPANDNQEESLEQIVETQKTLAADRSRQGSNTEPTP